jgi:squalene-hopene/tetraprenyl-beta-curcumene cyclase
VDGSWDELAEGRNGESYYTGTGFPRVFYLGYHLYKQYFPLLALTTYRRVMEREVGAA